MKYLAAYLLLTVGGKASPSTSDIETVLSTVGIESESARVESLLNELQGKNLEELIAAGNEKLATVPSGGAAAAPAAAGGAATPAAEEAKKEEAKEEEESDEDMGFGLFD
ncbi:60S acidic ribosomal protein P2B subunit [Schizosaccharomyces cryophilus OY26]|uniref:60S acidic ribosomal protein P2B subunit n=1 Tax=Schizosaccharomyces cryophilus (strain OY26 / ATCC MYA-4695 / CBS 11777 / NBRC 106824 / NRRL Y48691) TaxID=653667 RepID=S9W177_SCHCR|nr:60S acidic ribosomal protein P2B subunit [Schizosaccharomyces cryophilus OY26]EPY53728.1 60S acidic ribosomal protein P2B subunit [Schizosaccharomyces cryophilus OY26]